MGETSSDDEIQHPENRLILAIVNCHDHPHHLIHGAGLTFARLISISTSAFSISRNPSLVSRNQFVISRNRGAVFVRLGGWSPRPDDTENRLQIQYFVFLNRKRMSRIAVRVFPISRNHVSDL